MPIVIEGRRPLNGKVAISGAKNAALPIIAATLLTGDECLLENVPYIEDIRVMVRVLQLMGVSVRFEAANTLRVKATRISTASLPADLARKMRASFLVAGPLLARFGQAEAPPPGGCQIGTRPVSVDLKGFQAMGGVIEFEERYVIRAPRLRGERLMLDYPSHTGTENLMMAACLAEGTTIIENASIEPEVVDLANFLCAMGARVYGAGTSTIRIEGTRRLHGAVYRVMPDRLEVGTFALGALVTGGDVTFDGAVSQWLGALTGKMREAGAEITASQEIYRVQAPQGPAHAADIQTYPYPGFPTDLQAPFTTAMTQAEGNSSIYETMFDSRLGYVSELRRMGARIDISGSGRMAMVHGPTPLRGAEVCALDIRSGAAVILAGLAAEGETRIKNVVYIDRGYENIEDKLRALGATITRLEDVTPPCPVATCSEPIEWEMAPVQWR